MHHPPCCTLSWVLLSASHLELYLNSWLASCSAENQIRQPSKAALLPLAPPQPWPPPTPPPSCGGRPSQAPPSTMIPKLARLESLSILWFPQPSRPSTPRPNLVCKESRRVRDNERLQQYSNRSVMFSQSRGVAETNL